MRMTKSFSSAPSSFITRVGERDGFDIAVHAGCTEEVGVELPELAQAPFLRPLVAEEVLDGIPPEREAELAASRRDHACDGGGHLGPQGDGALAPVGEGIGLLADDLLTRFRRVELGRFEDGRVHLLVPERFRGAAHRGKDVLLHALILRIEVPDAFIRLDHDSSRTVGALTSRVHDLGHMLLLGLADEPLEIDGIRDAVHDELVARCGGLYLDLAEVEDVAEESREHRP